MQFIDKAVGAWSLETGRSRYKQVDEWINRAQSMHQWNIWFMRFFVNKPTFSSRLQAFSLMWWLCNAVIYRLNVARRRILHRFVLLLPERRSTLMLILLNIAPHYCSDNVQQCCSTPFEQCATLLLKQRSTLMHRKCSTINNVMQYRLNNEQSSIFLLNVQRCSAKNQNWC